MNIEVFLYFNENFFLHLFVFDNPNLIKSYLYVSLFCKANFIKKHLYKMTPFSENNFKLV